MSIHVQIFTLKNKRIILNDMKCTTTTRSCLFFTWIWEIHSIRIRSKHIINRFKCIYTKYSNIDIWEPNEFMFGNTVSIFIHCLKIKESRDKDKSKEHLQIIEMRSRIILFINEHNRRTSEMQTWTELRGNPIFEFSQNCCIIQLWSLNTNWRSIKIW